MGYNFRSSVLLASLSLLSIVVLFGCSVIQPISPEKIDFDHLSNYLAEDEWVKLKTVEGETLAGKLKFMDLNTITIKDGPEASSLRNLNYSEIVSIHKKTLELNSGARLVKTDKTILRGILNEVKEDKLIFHDTEVGPVEVYPFEIKSIQIRSLKRIRAYAGVGAAGGYIIGFIIGANQAEIGDCGLFPCFDDIPKAYGEMLLFGLAGGLIGTGIGSLIGDNIYFDINGSSDSFERNLTKMTKYAIPREHYEWIVGGPRILDN